MTDKKEDRNHPIEYSVDGEKQTTTEKVLTPTEILRNAGINPAEHYLIQILGNHKESYADKPDHPIHMHPGMRFVSASKQPTQVS